jgi:hypothetical protein
VQVVTPLQEIYSSYRVWELARGVPKHQIPSYSKWHNWFKKESGLPDALFIRIPGKNVAGLSGYQLDLSYCHDLEELSRTGQKYPF